jgi:hypothetical protein
VKSIAVGTIGTPTVVFWFKDSESDSHQMNGSLESDAVSRLGMLQLLPHALLNNRRWPNLVADTVAAATA